MNIFINAGHWKNDPGASVGKFIERDLVMVIRDEVRKLLPDAIYITDDLNIWQSVSKINAMCKPDDIAIDIHLNSHSNPLRRGVECYYYNNYNLAKTLATSISAETGIPNAGPKPDSVSYLGNLSFVRDLNCQSVIVECGYMTNTLDLNLIVEKPDVIARGIFNALNKPSVEELTRQLTILQKIFTIYTQIIALMKEKKML
jgi:N-acetylmuramoyl-L-alanine amidase